MAKLTITQSFLKQMDENSARRLIYDQTKYDNGWLRLVESLTRRILVATSRLTRIRIDGCGYPLAAGQRARLIERHARQCNLISLADNDDDDEVGERRPARGLAHFRPCAPLAQVWLALYLVSFVDVLANMFFQYNYDFNLVRWRRLMALQLSATDDKQEASQVLERAVAVRNELRRYHAILCQMGAPCLSWSFSIECVYLFSLEVSLVIYLAGHYYYEHLQPFDYALIRSFMNRRRECERENQLVCQEMCRVALSSEHFVHNQQRSHLDQDEADRSIRLSKLLQRHEKTLKQLRQLALAGKLCPLNRSYVWLRDLRVFFCVSAVTIIFTSTLNMTLFATLAPELMKSLHMDLRLTGWRDWRYVAELAVLLVTIAVATVSHQYVFFIHAFDLNKFVERLRQLQLDTIALSAANFEHFKYHEFLLAKERQSSHFEHHHSPEQQLAIDSVDAKLLASLVQLRLLRHETASLRREFSVNLGVVLLLVLSVPVMVRLHVPYMGPTSRHIALIICFIALLAACATFAPICFLRSRCFDLYKCMYSLLAQLDQFELKCLSVGLSSKSRDERADSSGDDDDDDEEEFEVRLFDQHSIELFRRQLRDAQLFVDQFSFKALGMTVAFADMIKLAFWLGLLIWSIYAEISSDQQQVLNYFLSDPLRIH